MIIELLERINIIEVDLLFCMFYYVVLFTPCVKSILGTLLDIWNCFCLNNGNVILN